MAYSVSLPALALLCLALLGSSLVQAGVPSRDRRSLYELDTLIGCYTGRSALMMINGYGCWCGLGGSGEPVDETDRCCKDHDYCYGILQKNRCGVYFSSYGYTQHGCESGRGTITCTAPSGCERALCECDRALAKCLRDNENTYHEEFANFEKRFCDVPQNAIPTPSPSNETLMTVVEGQERNAYQIDTGAGTADVPVEGVLRQLSMRGNTANGRRSPPVQRVLGQLDIQTNVDGAVDNQL